MAARPCLRPWKDEYQLLCSIDSVSGEMKSISPFQVPKPLLHDLDNQTATSIESHFKVIENITDFQESKTFRARLSGTISSFWNAEMSFSALDSAKVNSKDIFGYYSLLFTKSRVVVNSSTLCNLTLNKDAEKAIRAGRYRDYYGDMIVVGYITGGEAEAVLRVTNFKEDRRESIRKELRMAMNDNDSAARISVWRGQADDNSKPSLDIPLENSRGDNQALADATTTLVSRRTGITHQDQLHNPSNFPKLLYQLSKAAENTGVKISALCYRVELFSQVPEDVLGFARAVVDENVMALQKQFAQVQFVCNSCEVYLAPGAVNNPREPWLREIRRLHKDSYAALHRFSQYKGYKDVGQLSANDPARRVGFELLQRFEDLMEKKRVAEVKAQAQQQLAKAEAKEKEKGDRAAQQGQCRTDILRGPAPAPAAPGPEAANQKGAPPASGPQGALTDLTAYQDGFLTGRVLGLRNFPSSKVPGVSIQPYLVVKLGSSTGSSSQVSAISPVASGLKPNVVVPWTFAFEVPVSAELLAEGGRLILEVYDKNMLKSDKLLGAVTIPLRQACGRTALVGLSPLQALVEDADRSKPMWYPVERVDPVAKYKCRGEINLTVKFSPGQQQLPLQAALTPPEAPGTGPLSSAITSPLTQGLLNNVSKVGPKQQQQKLPPADSPPDSYDGSDGRPSVTDSAYVAPPTFLLEPMPETAPTNQADIIHSDDEGYDDVDGSSDEEGYQPATPSVTQVRQDRLARRGLYSEPKTSNAGSDPLKLLVSPEGRMAASGPAAANSPPEVTAHAVQVRAKQTDAAEAAVDAAAQLNAAVDHKRNAGHQGPEAKSKKVKKAHRRLFGLAVRLLMTGAVLGASCAAAVVVGRKHFGVDLVAESAIVATKYRGIVVQYGEGIGLKARMWARRGGGAVSAWSRTVAMRWRRKDGRLPASIAESNDAGAPVSFGPCSVE